MTHTLVFILFSIVAVSCTQPEISKIEIVKLDQKVLDSLTQNSDTSYSVIIGGEDFHSADQYLIYKDSILTKVFRNKAGYVVGIARSQNGNHIFGVECYANRQLKGKTQYKEGHVDGSVTYYYEDGRIRSTGQWNNHNQTGTWKSYHNDGTLETIEYHNSDGEIVKTEEY